MGDAGGAGGNNMNIKQAKNEVKNTVKAYLSKDAHGEYVIPQIRQRPMLLIGPPGVGKTQIMESAYEPSPRKEMLRPFLLRRRVILNSALKLLLLLSPSEKRWFLFTEISLREFMMLSGWLYANISSRGLPVTAYGSSLKVADRLLL